MGNGTLYNRIQQVKQLVEQYVYPTSLTTYLKTYFQQNKHLGGRDRKQIKHWFYLYFKSDKPFNDLEEELIWLLHNDDADVLARLKEPNDSKPETLAMHFPLQDKISKLLTKEQRDFLKAEKLFWVRTKAIDHPPIASYKDLLFGYEQGTPIQGFDQIQDLASFQCVEAMLAYIKKPHIKIWDACAGAGGKSLALINLLSHPIDLYTSDVRGQMRKELLNRLNQKGYEHKQHAIVDLIDAHHQIDFNGKKVGQNGFDGIILDLPCSGSGTWGRNPQHLRYFDEKRLENFLYLQNTISANALAMLKGGGLVFYITCSVYKAENEILVKGLLKKHDLELLEQKYFGNAQSDVLFLSVLRKH